MTEAIHRRDLLAIGSVHCARVRLLRTSSATRRGLLSPK